MANRDLPRAQGLYDPANEHDACGVAFVVDLHGRKSHDMVRKGINALCNLDHRGASGCEVNTGDGAGILLQIPDAFLRAVVDFELPAAGAYATGIAFLPKDRDDADKAVAAIDAIVADEGLQRPRLARRPDRRLDARRDRAVGRAVVPPAVHRRRRALAGLALERRAFIVRKRIEHEVDDARGPRPRRVYFPSLSCRTLVYKGMLTTPQLEEFYADLRDERVESALALVHSRFSTNTFPSWPLAHPYRYIAHNGEINTLKGNRNWMRAREALLAVGPVPRRARPRLPDLHARRLGLVVVRRGARAPRARRPVAAALGADDDPGGVGEPHVDERGEEGVLPVPRVADGAVGRPRVDRVHRRHRHRRGARPQRPPPVPLLGHRRRARDHGERGRRARGRPGEGREEGPARARAACSSSTRPQGRIVDDEEIKHDARDRAPVRAVARRRARPPRRPAAARRAHPGALVAGAAAAAVRLDPGGAAHPHRADGAHRRGGDRLDGHRHADRRAVGPAAPAVRLLPAAVRAGHEPAARRHPRGARHQPRLDDRARRATCSTPGPESCRQIVLPHPVLDNEDLAKLRYIDEERRRRGLQAGHDRRALPGARRRRRAAARDRAHPPPGERRDRRRREPRHPLGPLRDRGARADPEPAHHRGGAPPPHPREDPHAGRPRHRDRRGPRGAPHRAAARVRRRRGQPVPRVRRDARPRPRGPPRTSRPARRRRTT